MKLHQRGELAQAEAGYRELLRKDPQHPQATYLLGLLASQTGQPALAVELISRHIDQHPQDAQALSILGLAHFDLHEYERCVALLERSLQINPNAVPTLHNLAQARFQLQDYAAARDAYQRWLGLEPDNVEAITGMALCDRELDQHESALALLEQAIVLDPRRAESHFFYGNVMRDLRQFRDAIDAFGTAITLRHDYLEAYVNCASTLKDLGLMSEALAFYDSALLLDPDHPEANYNRALLLLSELKLAEGWRLYERRLDSDTSIRKFIGGQRIRVAPDWDGESDLGSLLVIGEQGLGDQVFFAGMLGELARQVPGADVCIEPRLVPLFARAMPQLNFIGPDQLGQRSYDSQIQLGSLGKQYRADEASLQRVRSPYLLADCARTAALRARISRGDRLVCGLSWLSKNRDHGDGKSLSLQALQPVLALPGIDFIDLQYGDTLAERQALATGHGLQLHKLDDIDNLNDIDGLAALISACDIVVTVSNTTAHLAAALGKPTLVMLPNEDALFWYWHRGSSTTPWYPSARLFRRSDTGSWDGVIDAVALTLAGIL